MERILEKPSCETCKKVLEGNMYKDKDDMFCNECVPPLLPQNEEAARMYMLVRGQVIIGGMAGVIIDLDFRTVFKVLEIYEVQDIRKCFEKIKRVSDKMIEIEREKADTSSMDKPAV